MVKSLWVDQYRPITVDDYVFKDERLKKQIHSFIKDKSFPNILLAGSPGTGKSSLARVLINEVGVDGGDVLYMNMSDTNGVDDVRDRITGFVSTIPMGDFKVVLLEEFDYATHNAQAALRRVLEDYSDSARFLITCNLLHKVIPAIRSRTQEILLQTLDIDSFKVRMIEILVGENVDFADEDLLDTYIKASYPDLRKCINMMQQHTFSGVLTSPSEDAGSSADWQIQAIDLIKKGKINEARKMITSQIRSEEYEDFYRLCYQNLSWWGDTEIQKEDAVLIIKDGLVNHSLCADSEINLSATLIKLARIRSE